MFSIFRNRVKSPSRTTRRSHDRVMLKMDVLETREVPAARPTALVAMKPVLFDGILSVVGTNKDDTIEVHSANGQLQILNKSFPIDDVRQVVIDGRSGDDTIVVSGSYEGRTHLFGGPGADVIQGGAGRDNILGGGGNDEIYGQAGDDTIASGVGRDYIHGGAGSDWLRDLSSLDSATSVSSEFSDGSVTLTYMADSFAASVVGDVVRLLNVQRAKRGLDDLSVDASLTYVANLHAGTMNDLRVPAKKGTSFSGSTMPTLDARLESNLVAPSSAVDKSVFRKLPEGKTANDLAKTIAKRLMAAGQFRKAILNPDFESVGLGIAGDAADGYYVNAIAVDF